MKTNLRRLAGAAVGAVVALGFTSCTYDPYYSSTSVGGSYGQGYGYGASSFSTSVFVGTGDSRWGYDPTCYSYYDYRRRAYYDPYLCGYYPVGYRPPLVYGVPHPYGWRPGSGHCRPPSRVSNVTVVNYSNRESAYRNSDYQWARQVRQQRSHDRSRESGYQNYQAPRSGNPSRTRQEISPRLPSGYNTPVHEIQSAPPQEPRRVWQERQHETRSQQQPAAQREIRTLSQPDEQQSRHSPERSASRGGNHRQAPPSDSPQNHSSSRENQPANPEAAEQGAPGSL